jgi:general secretion pathway protein D
MSIIQQAKRPISFPSLALRLQLAVSAAGLVAMSGCVAVDQPAAKRPMPPGANTMAKPSTELMQRPPAEVRMSAEQMTEPTIQKGTGRFIDTSAQLSRTGKGNYVVKLNAVPVADAVQQVLGDTLGLSYVVEGEIAGAISVDTARPVDQRTLLEMLSGALAGSGAALINEGGFYRVTTAEAALASTSRIVGYGSSVSDLKVGPGVQVVPLRYISATEMEKILKPIAPEGAIARVDVARNLLIIKSDSRSTASLLEMVDMFDVDYMAGMSFALLPVKNTSATGLVTELDQLFGAASGTPMAGLVRFIPIERLNAVMAISPQPQQLEQVQTWMERLDRSGRLSDQSFHVVPLQNRAAKEVAELLQRTLSDNPQEQSSNSMSANTVRPDMTPVVTETSGQGKAATTTTISTSGASLSSPPTTTMASATGKPIRIQADDGNNSLLILSTPEEFQLLQQVVSVLDVAPNQVMLEATIAEVTLNDDLAYGINWFLESGEFNLTFSGDKTGSVAPTFPGFSVLFSGEDGRAALSAVASMTDVKVLSSPSLMVLDNRTATLQVGDQVPIVTQTSASTIDANAPIVNQVEMRDTGVILKVTPRVNEGGRVSLEIEQEVSDVTQTKTSGIDSPTIQQRKIKTSVAVDNGSTIALGGLIRDRVTDGATKIPLLGDIPMVGELFRTNTKRNERTELVVLITPRVVGSASDAEIVTRELREKMRGVGIAIDAANARSLSGQ